MTAVSSAAKFAPSGAAGVGVSGSGTDLKKASLRESRSGGKAGGVGSVLKVSPCVGEFSDIGTDLIYVIRFTLYNTSSKVQRVRFYPPESTAFALVTQPQSMAPGLNQDIEVEFCTKEVRDYNDSFSIVTDVGTLHVPLHAWFPRPCINFAPEVDLGVVPVQHNASHTLVLTNTGRSPGAFTFKSDGMGQGLAVSPATGTVDPGKKKEVQVNYFGGEPGLFVSVVQVDLPEQSNRQLKVTARVVESKVDIHSSAGMPVPGGIVDFGTAYYGQRRSIEVFLVNGSPFSTSFTIHHPETTRGDGDSDSVPGTPPPPPIEASPSDGRIQKQQSAMVKLLFQPVCRGVKTGFLSVKKTEEARTWRQTFGVEIAETEQRLDLVLTGRAVHPDVELSQTRFAFPSTPVHQHADNLLTVTNNAELPVDIATNKVAHFAVSTSGEGRVGPPWRLAPHSDMNLILTFKPSQLGKFPSTINLSLCGGIATLPIQVYGTSSCIGPKRALVGGPDKTAQDFQKELKYAGPARPPSGGPPGPNGRQTKARESTAANYPWMTDEEDEVALLQMNEIQQRREHNQLYNKYVTQSRLNREYAQKVSQEGRMARKEAAAIGQAAYLDKTLVDIGMVPGEGLREPEPRIHQRIEPWKAEGERSREDGDGARMLKKTTKFDENRLIKKKFKKEPMTLSEQRECKMVLSAKDLNCISYGPRMLDFGKVTVYSTNTKSFCVQNTLKSHIIVRIPVSLRDELAHSFPASQVIPPGQTAGFDIVFNSDTEQTFTQAMWFQLNDTHKLKFLLHAEAIPIDVSLSQEKMDFRFNDFVLDPTLTQNLTLTNHGNSEASFSWGDEHQDSAFSFNPTADTIPPHGQRNIEITYTPQQSNESQCTAYLAVQGGPTRKLSLSGSVQDTRCAFTTQKVDFGPVAVGSSVQRTVSIKSFGPSSTVFSIVSLPPGLTVNTSRNRLAANQSHEVVMTLRPTQAASLQCQLVCNIRGMKQPLRLAVKAEPKIPKVELRAVSGLDFDKVIVGTHEYRHLELCNVGGIPATLLLDMSDVPDFQLCDENHVPVESTTEPDEDSHDDVMIVCRSDEEDADDSGDDVEADDSSQGMPTERHGLRYKLIVSEKSTLRCALRFTPTSVQPHTFPLLMSLLGIPVADTSHELMKQVTAEALKPRLVLSHSAIEFGSCVVVKDGTSKNPNVASLRLTNEMTSELRWDIVLPQDAHMNEIFRYTPTSGTLAPGHSSSVQISFLPTDVRPYHTKVGVFLDGNKAKKYMDVSVSGSGSNPAITFDRRELLLPFVPLDVPAKAAFMINNEGYDNLDLKYRLPGAAKWNEPGTLPIQIAFPEGSVLGGHHSQIPVEITCCARKATSFTACIDFCDDEEQLFSIPVSFAAENSVLTAYPYLATHKPADAMLPGYTLSAETDRKPVVMRAVEDGQEATTPRLAPTARSEARSHAGSGYDTDQTNTYKVADKINRKAFTKRNAERLKTWLNHNVLQDPIEDFVAGMVAGHGRCLMEMVEQLAGRPPPSAIKPDKVQHMSKRDLAAAEYKQYEDCITFLKGQGGVLIDVRPEFLMRYEDFQRLTVPHKGWGGGLGASAPTPQCKVGERSRARVGERKFGHKQLHAWMSLVLQVLKCFLLSRVTWRGFRSMPQSAVMQARAVEEKWANMSNDSSTVGSNLYSQSEAILLKWLSLHQQHYFPRGHHRVTSFDELRDCRAFAAVLCAYIPTLEARVGLAKPASSAAAAAVSGDAAASGFVSHPSSMADCERNAGVLLEAAKAYGMDFKLTPKEFVEGSTRDLLLLALNLFQSLPQFVPQASITFAGKLHETITKTVELTNPHRWPIDYLVLLDDESGEFRIDKGDNKLRLESRSSATLPIWIAPRFSRATRARLTFLSVGRLGPNAASTIVFNVETSIDTEQSVHTVHLEAPLYELLNHELEFENPFDERAAFSVQCLQQHVRDPAAKTPAYGEEASSGSFQDAFWTAQDVINVKKKEKAKLNLQFVPFMRGQYTCKIVLSDERVGEIICLVKGTALPPLSFEKVAFQTELATPQTREVPIPLKNAAQEKGSAALHNERFKGFKSKMKAADKGADKVSEQNLRYKVEYSSPFFTGPKEISLAAVERDAPDKPATAEEGKQQAGDAKGPAGAAAATATTTAAAGKKAGGAAKMPLVLPVTFHPRGPGVYPGKITLTSDCDVRVVEVEGKSRSPGMSADLDFSCHARQVIQQELPITNNTNKDWTIQATLNGEYFAGAREVIVKAGKVKNFLLTFSPLWVCDVTGQLQLKNTDTLEKYCYNLHGKADEPLAEDTIAAECVARDTQTVVIDVPNITNDDVLYSVETDVPFARGSPTLIVPKMEVGKYTLTLKPTLSGKTTGSITFSTPADQYLWFVLGIGVGRPPPERTIDIRATVRKAVVAEISVGNPSAKEVSFMVRRRGDGLLGDNRLTVQPRSSETYQLLYNPLCASQEGKPNEGQLSFFNDDLGEHWYVLSLAAEEAEPEELPEVHCELGKSKPIELSLTNPVDQDLTLSVSCSNTQNFTVSPPGTLTLPPYGTAHPVVTYMPSAIAQRQEARVQLTHPRLGKWEYVVRGSGSPPTVMEPVTVTAVSTRSQQTSVVFRNPFPLPRRFAVTLKDTPSRAPPAAAQEAGSSAGEVAPPEAAASPFELMLKRKTVTVGPFSSLTIPLSYSPTSIAEHKTAVVVQAVGEGVAADLRWEYPVVGVAEAMPVDNVYRFSSRCRSELSQTVSLALHQVTLAEGETFTHEVVFPETFPYAAALRNAVSVQAAYDEARVQGDTVKMDYMVSFNPLRPFTATVELLIRKQSGGLWRFELHFDALPPPPDDTIHLEAAMSQRGSVAFALANVFGEDLAYRAYYTSDSAAEFTVSPAKGVLPAAAGAATEQQPVRFVVSFSSSQYGKTLNGTLVIETDLIEWRYDVKGM